MIALTPKLSLTAAALALLGACGGTTVPLPTGNDRLRLSEIQDIEQSISAGYNDTATTPKAFVPVSGGATYNGYVAGNLAVPGKTTDVAGLAQVGVNFGTNRVGGTVGNFVTAAGNDIDGTLSVRNGVLNRTLNSSQVTILADVDGTLRTANETISVVGGVNQGGFKGNNAQYMGLPMKGNIAVNGPGGTQSGTFALNGALVQQ